MKNNRTEARNKNLHIFFRSFYNFCSKHYGSDPAKLAPKDAEELLRICKLERILDTENAVIELASISFDMSGYPINKSIHQNIAKHFEKNEDIESQYWANNFKFIAFVIQSMINLYPVIEDLALHKSYPNSQIYKQLEKISRTCKTINSTYNSMFVSKSNNPRFKVKGILSPIDSFKFDPIFAKLSEIVPMIDTFLENNILTFNTEGKKQSRQIEMKNIADRYIIILINQLSKHATKLKSAPPLNMSVKKAAKISIIQTVYLVMTGILLESPDDYLKQLQKDYP